MSWNVSFHQQKEIKYAQLTEPRGREALDNGQMQGLEIPIAITVRNRGQSGANMEDIIKEVKLQRPMVDGSEIKRVTNEMIHKKYLVVV